MFANCVTVVVIVSYSVCSPATQVIMHLVSLPINNWSQKSKLHFNGLDPGNYAPFGGFLGTSHRLETEEPTKDPLEELYL